MNKKEIEDLEETKEYKQKKIKYEKRYEKFKKENQKYLNKIYYNNNIGYFKVVELITPYFGKHSMKWYYDEGFFIEYYPTRGNDSSSIELIKQSKKITEKQFLKNIEREAKNFINSVEEKIKIKNRKKVGGAKVVNVKFGKKYVGDEFKEKRKRK